MASDGSTPLSSFSFTLVVVTCASGRHFLGATFIHVSKRLNCHFPLVGIILGIIMSRRVLKLPEVVSTGVSQPTLAEDPVSSTPVVDKSAGSSNDVLVQVLQRLQQLEARLTASTQPSSTTQSTQPTQPSSTTQSTQQNQSTPPTQSAQPTQSAPPTQSAQLSAAPQLQTVPQLQATPEATETEGALQLPLSPDSDEEALARRLVIPPGASSYPSLFPVSSGLSSKLSGALQREYATLAPAATYLHQLILGLEQGLLATSEAALYARQILSAIVIPRLDYLEVYAEKRL